MQVKLLLKAASQASCPHHVFFWQPALSGRLGQHDFYHASCHHFGQAYPAPCERGWTCIVHVTTLRPAYSLTCTTVGSCYKTVAWHWPHSYRGRYQRSLTCTIDVQVAVASCFLLRSFQLPRRWHSSQRSANSRHEAGRAPLLAQRSIVSKQQQVHDSNLWATKPWHSHSSVYSFVSSAFASPALYADVQHTRNRLIALMLFATKELTLR